MKSPRRTCWRLTLSENLCAKTSLSAILSVVLWAAVCWLGVSSPIASVQALEMVKEGELFRVKVSSLSTNTWSMSDLEKVVPGIKEKVVDDLVNRGFLGYTPDQILVATKKKQAVMVIEQAEFNTRGIVVRQGKLFVPTIDSPKPLEYSLDAVVVQKLKFDPKVRDPDAIARSQRAEIFGVPKAKFSDLYYRVKGGLYFSRAKNVICVLSKDRLRLRTAWGDMHVEPGDAIMYPVERQGDWLSILPPYRHAGGEFLSAAYCVELSTTSK